MPLRLVRCGSFSLHAPFFFFHPWIQHGWSPSVGFNCSCRSAIDSLTSATLVRGVSALAAPLTVRLASRLQRRQRRPWRRSGKIRGGLRWRRVGSVALAFSSWLVSIYIKGEFGQKNNCWREWPVGVHALDVRRVLQKGARLHPAQVGLQSAVRVLPLPRARPGFCASLICFPLMLLNAHYNKKWRFKHRSVSKNIWKEFVFLSKERCTIRSQTVMTVKLSLWWLIDLLPRVKLVTCVCVSWVSLESTFWVVYYCIHDLCTMGLKNDKEENGWGEEQDWKEKLATVIKQTNHKENTQL